MGNRFDDLSLTAFSTMFLSLLTASSPYFPCSCPEPRSPDDLFSILPFFTLHWHAFEKFEHSVQVLDSFPLFMIHSPPVSFSFCDTNNRLLQTNCSMGRFSQIDLEINNISIIQMLNACKYYYCPAASQLTGFATKKKFFVLSSL